MAKNYRIHYHAWTQFEMLEILHVLRQKYTFDFETMHRRKDEVIFIIRKEIT